MLAGFVTWAESGGMALTGWPDEEPLPPPGPVLERAGSALDAFRKWAGVWGTAPEVDLADALFGRAALMGLTRRGQVSANGTCRLIRAADTWLAVNLARPDDLCCVPAVIGRELRCDEDAWAALRGAAIRSSASDLAERAQLLGVPASVLGGSRAGPKWCPDSSWPVSTSRPMSPRWPVSLRLPVRWTGAGTSQPRRRSPRIVDLSVMWAGPLCARLLRDAGAEVIKVEASTRPDGARSGPPAFWDRLHADQQILTIDLDTAGGTAELRELIAGADAVIESSRPRALAQRGLVAEELAGPDLTWISVTGYGRTGAAAAKVAFGDDAAVAGGLVGTDVRGEPVFCGDALADPLAGLVAAAAGARALANGGGLVAVSMADVAAWAAS